MFTKDPITAPGPYENKEASKLVAIAPALTLFTTTSEMVPIDEYGQTCQVAPLDGFINIARIVNAVQCHN